jgi:hypothetical protein
MDALATLPVIARQLTIISLQRKPGSLKRHRDVSGLVPGFEDSQLEPKTGDADDTAD